MIRRLNNMPIDAPKHMTVAQAIDFLSKIGDKSMAVMIDCPHCGKGSQIAFIEEAVILSSTQREE